MSPCLPTAAYDPRKIYVGADLKLTWRRSVTCLGGVSLRSLLAPAQLGYCELKERPTRLAAARPQPSAVGLDDRPADRQSHTHAFGLGRVEGIKQAFQTLGAQPWAGVLHADAHAGLFDCLCTDPQLPRAIGSGIPFSATRRRPLSSHRRNEPESAPQRRVAFTRIASKMGCNSCGELAMACSTSDMAARSSSSSVTRSSSSAREAWASAAPASRCVFASIRLRLVRLTVRG